MIYNLSIEVSTRDGVLNPESKAILQALRGNDYEVLDLKMTRKFYVQIESDSKEEARLRGQKMCEELLANPTIQMYSITIEDSK